MKGEIIIFDYINVMKNEKTTTKKVEKKTKIKKILTCHMCG